MAYYTYKVFEDTSFLTGDSPATHDIAGALGQAGQDGYIDNYGTGVLTFAISHNGTDYGDEIKLTAGQVHNFGRSNNTIATGNVPIQKIRVTWVSNTSYKIYIN